MSGTQSDDPLLEMYLFESSQLIEQLEATFLSCESAKSFSSEAIGDIFRNMHTIKGSAAMMSYKNISEVAHAIEDLFYRIREDGSVQQDYKALFELIWDGLDFIKVETHKIRHGHQPDGDATDMVRAIKEYLDQVYAQEVPLRTYEAVVSFTDDCQMENVRAFALLHQLREHADVTSHHPEDIAANEHSADIIRREGFRFTFHSREPEEQLVRLIKDTMYLNELRLTPAGAEARLPLSPSLDVADADAQRMVSRELSPSSMISVSVDKLDSLMDLVGEMVIAEAMVTQHDALKDIASTAFLKSAGHLRKITGELQDIVMSIRMVPLTTTFHKMHRVIRDMSKKLDKEVDVRIHGEETEVDKNIIEQISDPLMHLVRNAVDHGLETSEERLRAGKSSRGAVTLEARNAGSDVMIIVKDDGAGLDKDKILRRALEQGLLPETDADLSDKEIYNLILLPGFSTKEDITQFSGRGVGMDVVYKNIEQVGGTILVESTPGQGTTISLQIPLTLAIIDGMNLKVAGSYYTLPITSIQESFKPKQQDLLNDPDGNEMIMVRGECYPIVRLQERLGTGHVLSEMTEGVLVMIDHDGRKLCVLVDELLGQQQVVVKTLPPYLRTLSPVKELAGCTLLADGNISLILNAAELISSLGRPNTPALSQA